MVNRTVALIIRKTCQLWWFNWLNYGTEIYCLRLLVLRSFMSGEAFLTSTARSTWSSLILRRPLTLRHERFLLKAKFYGISGKLNNWLQAFLTGRRQCVVVKGASTKWAPALSGVPQGTILGPISFLLFINNLPSSVSSSVKFFADESVLYRYIESTADQNKLQ